MPFAGDAPRHHDIVVDGVAYKIVIERVADRYSASWMCLACAELAGSTLGGDTPDEAIERAKDCVTHHHDRFHRGRVA